MLCQIIEIYRIPREIIKIIFMIVYQRVKIKTDNDTNNIIINTNISHLFIYADDNFREYVNNKKFIDIVKSGIKYIYVDLGEEYVITLGLDGTIRFLDFVNDEVKIIDKKIRYMHMNIRLCHGATTFNVISYENILSNIVFTYSYAPREFTYKISNNILFPVRKIKKSDPESIIISMDGIAYWEYFNTDWTWNWNDSITMELNNVMSACCVSTMYPEYIFLKWDGSLYYADKENDNRITLFPFDKNIAYVKSNSLHVIVITADGYAYQWSSHYAHRIFRKIRKNVKSVYCTHDYNIFLLKNGKVKCLWS